VRQEQEAARLAEEMAAARRQEEELRAQVEAEEEARLGFEESYASLEAELEGKSKKLAKLKSKYATVQAEIADVQEEANREKESILESIRELSRQLKLKQLIMGAFIPLDELSKIERCSEWDDATEQWRISRLQYAGNPRAKSAGRVSMSPGQSSPLARRTASATNNDPEQRRDARLFDAAASMASVFFTYAVSGDEARASEPTARRLRVGDADS
jgi:kinesin family protein 3/17